MTYYARFRSAPPVLFALLALAACSKKSDPSPAAPLSTMSWTVDGGPANAVSIVAEISASGVIGLRGYGQQSSTGSTSVLLYLPNRVGTFTLPATGGTSASYRVDTYTSTSSSGVMYQGSAGTLTVSSYTASAALGGTKVTGTFSFTGTQTSGGSGTKALSNGSFDVTF
jgi:hypothetical protein